jgi:uncharacterized protein YbaR (Trm112 family)
MIADDLLAILCCPETHQPLSPAGPEILAGVNARISAAGPDPLRNRGGEPVGEPVTEALVRLDRTLLYPIRDGIPILLVEEAIFL